MNPKVKTIGFNEVFDICQILIFKLNPKESWAKRIVVPGNELSDIQYAFNFVELFSKPSSRMKLFFDVENQKTAFLSNYFQNIENRNEIKNIEGFNDIILADRNFKNEVIQFYLDQTFESEQSALYNIAFEQDELNSMCKENLLQFVLFPDKYIQELCNMMLDIKEELSGVYSKQREQLEILNETFDLNLLIQSKQGIKLWCEALDEIEVSFSLCNQYIVMSGLREDKKGWMLLGVRYLSVVTQAWGKGVSLATICNALGDDLRVLIVTEMLKAGEMCISEIVKKLNLTISAVTYHIDVLKKSYILGSRVKGRTTFYWVNRSMFGLLIDRINELEENEGWTKNVIGEEVKDCVNGG